MHRRELLKSMAAGMVAGGALLSDTAYSTTRHAAGVGICDWNLGGASDPELIPKAARAAKGKPLVNLIRIETGDRIHAVVPVRSAVRPTPIMAILTRLDGALAPRKLEGRIAKALPPRAEALMNCLRFFILEPFSCCRLATLSWIG